jgi:hypothetical protein
MRPDQAMPASREISLGPAFAPWLADPVADPYPLVPTGVRGEQGANAKDVRGIEPMDRVLGRCRDELELSGQVGTRYSAHPLAERTRGIEQNKRPCTLEYLRAQRLRDSWQNSDAKRARQRKDVGFLT